jgi:hypothetical protein
MLENKLQSCIFSHKAEDEIRGWRKLHNVERHNVYSSRNIFKDHKIHYCEMCKAWSTHEK